jgi:hypothetical protein
MKKPVSPIEEHPMTMTALLEIEMKRVMDTLERYKARPGANVEHAALRRATLDLSRTLAQWRKKPVWQRERGQVK